MSQMISKRFIHIDIVSFSLAVQLAVLGLIYMSKMGIEMPIIRPIIALIYLAFIPGLLILNIMDINVSLTKTILLSLALSLSFITFFTLFINSLLLKIGIDYPLSEINLAISYCIMIIIFIGICRLINRSNITFNIQMPFNINLILSLILLPVLIMFGSLDLMFNDKNGLLIILLIIIAFIPLFSIGKSDTVFPIILWAVSISLIIHTNLLYAGKSFYESYIPGVVVSAGFWNPVFATQDNSLLTTALLLPVFARFLGVDIIWGVHITIWFIFSFIPVILYAIYSSLYRPILSFMAVCLFIFMPFFYTQELIMYAQRTGFAMLFISLYLLIILSRDIDKMKKNVLAVVLLFSIAVSHYGASYFLMIVLTLSIVLMIAIGIEEVFTLRSYLIFLIFQISWFIYTSSSENFNWIVSFADYVWANINDLFSVEETPMLSMVLKSYSISIELAKYINIMIIIVLLFGTLTLSLPRIIDLCRNRASADSYLDTHRIMAICSVMILFTQILPHGFGATRLLGLILIFAAPFVVLSFMKFSRYIKLSYGAGFKIFSLFLIILLFIGSGIISNTVNAIAEKDMDYSLNRLMDRENIQRGEEGKWALYWTWRYDSTICALDWFIYHARDGRIYADWCFRSHFITREGTSWVTNYYNALYDKKYIYIGAIKPNPYDILVILNNINNIGINYIFLGYHNLKENLIIVNESYNFKTSNYAMQLGNKSLIYSTGADNILYINV
jgi:uncharacterized membrane protein